MLKTHFTRRSSSIARLIAGSHNRSLLILTIRLAKNDSSSIDSYKLPSQTSINEWEFKYDFVPKVSEPKVPPVSAEAIQQEKAQVKKQQVERELLTKELNSSIKVEANDASVVHGGESVGTEPELLQDRGSAPVDAHGPGYKQAKKIDSSKYQQLSLNEDINNPMVVNLGHNTTVENPSGTVDVPPEVHDAEEAEKATIKPLQEQQVAASSGLSPAAVLALLGLGGFASYYAFSSKKKN